MKRFLTCMLAMLVLITSIPAEMISVSAAEFVSGDNSLLTDDFRLTYAEWRQRRLNTRYPDNRPSSSLAQAQFVKLDTVDGGIEWTYDEPTEVKRLDMWVWPAYAIDTYEVQSYDEATGWNTVFFGDWNPYDEPMGETSDDQSNETQNTFWYSAVLDNAVTTKKLRFVVKSFADSSYGAYVAEADVGTSNEIDIVNKEAEIYQTGSTTKKFNIYIKNYHISARSDGSSSLTAAASSENRSWPGSYNVVPDSEGNAWYAAWLQASHHAISRAVINIASGTVTDAEIWCSNSDDAWSAQATDDNWVKVLAVSGGSFTETMQIDIPNAPKAEYWKVKITGYTGDLELSPMELYETTKAELSPFGKAIAEVFDVVTNEEKVTTTMNFPASVTTAAMGDVAVIWGCDNSDIVDISTGNVTQQEEDTEVTISATITNSSDATVWTVYKQFVIDGTTPDPTPTPTPTPIPTPDPEAGSDGESGSGGEEEATPTPTPTPDPEAGSDGEGDSDDSSGEETEPPTDEDTVSPISTSIFNSAGNLGTTTLLEDNFRLTFPEWRINKLGNYSRPASTAAKEQFVKLDTIDSGIEWTYDEEIEAKRIDMWVWPVYAIDTYEVQSYDEASDTWNTVYVGDWNPNDAALGATSGTGADNITTLWYSAVLDEAVTAKKLRFVVKKFTDQSVGAYVAEADVGTTNEINITDKEAEIYETASTTKKFNIYLRNYYVSARADGGVLTASNSSEARSWPGSQKVVPDSEGKVWYSAWLYGSHHAISRAVIKIASGTVTGAEVWCSDSDDAWSSQASDDNWVKVASVSDGNFTDTLQIDIPDSIEAEYWKVKITGYTSDLQLSQIELYEMKTAELSPFGKALNEIFDNVIQGVVIGDEINVPAVINTQSVGDVAVSWSCDTDKLTINMETGEISNQPTDDVEITLKASVTNPEDSSVRNVEKKFWVRGIDARPDAMLVSESFDGALQDTFVNTNGNVAVSGGEAHLTGNASAELDLSVDERFEYNRKAIVSLALGNSSTGGKVIFKKGETTLLELEKDASFLNINYSGKTEKLDYAENIKIEFCGDTFNILTDSGSGYNIVFYNAKLTASGTPDTISLSAKGDDRLSIADVKMEAKSADLLSEVSRQFDFSKISTDGTANVKSDLTLLSSLKDITFSYSSSDGAINSTTGAVDTSAALPVNLTVTATSIGGSFTKTFNTMVTGLTNVLKGAGVSFIGVVRAGYSAANIADDDLGTSLISESESGWTVTVTMPKATYFNKIALHEAIAEGSVTGFVISVSSDGTNYTDVYTGTAVNSGTLIDIGLKNARYVRVRATGVTGAGSGLKEICAYLDPSDRERVEFDIVNATEKITMPANGTTFPKTALFGSSITVTSNYDLITVNESGDNLVLAFGKPDEETTVTLTVTASYGEASESKEYKVVMLADSENIRDNEISKGNGGGGGGGGGSTSKGSAAFVPGLKNVPQESIYDVYAKELEGHWGAKEIQALIDAGIVTGDGESLNLKKTVKRGEVLKMLIEAFDIETVKYNGGFLDVTDRLWYADYAETAKQLGIMVGDGVNFRGDDPITREEMAVVLVNVLRRLEADLNSSTAVEFTDKANISSWASDSVNTASGVGLLKGYETGEFMPRNNLMRDEAMVVIARAIELLESQTVEVAE